jgi:hypothetical protein
LEKPELGPTRFATNLELSVVPIQMVVIFNVGMSVSCMILAVYVVYANHKLQRELSVGACPFVLLYPPSQQMATTRASQELDEAHARAQTRMEKARSRSSKFTTFAFGFGIAFSQQFIASHQNADVGLWAAVVPGLPR